jgi:hypothetical protein
MFMINAKPCETFPNKGYKECNLGRTFVRMYGVRYQRSRNNQLFFTKRICKKMIPVAGKRYSLKGRLMFCISDGVMRSCPC